MIIYDVVNPMIKCSDCRLKETFREQDPKSPGLVLGSVVPLKKVSVFHHGNMGYDGVIVAIKVISQLMLIP